MVKRTALQRWHFPLHDEFNTEWWPISILRWKEGFHMEIGFQTELTEVVIRQFDGREAWRFGRNHRELFFDCFPSWGQIT